MKRMINPLLCCTAVFYGAIATSQAATTMWLGSVSTDWADTNNWSNGVPTNANGDIVEFNADTASSLSITNISGAITESDYRFSGDGNFIFNGNGFFAFGQNGSLSASGSVGLISSSGISWRPSLSGSAWNSSGTFRMNGGYQYIFYQKNSGGVFTQTAGEVVTNGKSLFQGNRGNMIYDLQGGTLTTSALFKGINNNGSSSIDINGGILNQTGNFNMRLADININSGAFIVDGVINSFSSGVINFSADSKGVLTTDNSLAEIQDFIDQGNIRIAGSGAVPIDFNIQDNGTSRSISLIPEPSSMALLGISTLLILARRRRA